jgi:hypothetical protein
MVNLDELRKKYEQVSKQNSNSGGDFLDKFFMLEKGKSTVRILPPQEGEQFYAETAIHRLNDKNYHCPRVSGGKCPVCDTYYDLWKRINQLGKTTPEGKELIAVTKAIKARKRYYMNVIDRRDGSVKILSIGMKLFGKILDTFFDEDYGDLTDMKGGWDYKIDKEVVGDDYPNYDKSAPRPKATEAGSAQECEAWLDQRHDIQGLVKVAEYDVLKELMLPFSNEPNPKTAEEVAQEDASAEGDGEEDYMASLKNIDLSNTED